MRPMDITAETVRLHAAGIRAVALRLMRDEDAAEDVVQETWIEALRHREPLARAGERPGPWLRTVARRLALRRLRGDARRAHREERAARPEHAATGDGSQPSPRQRAQVFGIVSEAILTLEEPYREALFLRYLEDRPPREVARQTGVPIATAKSRLARGLAKVRERVHRELADEGVDPLAGLALLCGVARPTPPLPSPNPTPQARSAPLTSTGAPMLKPALLLFASTAASLAVWTHRPVQDPDPATQTQTASQALEPLTSPAGLASPVQETDPTETRVPVAPATSNEVARPTTRTGAESGQNFATLAVTLTGPEGLPSSGVDLYVASELGPWNFVGRTDAFGRLSFPRRDASSPLVLAAGSDGLLLPVRPSSVGQHDVHWSLPRSHAAIVRTEKGSAWVTEERVAPISLASPYSQDAGVFLATDFRQLGRRGLARIDNSFESEIVFEELPRAQGTPPKELGTLVRATFELTERQATEQAPAMADVSGTLSLENGRPAENCPLIAIMDSGARRKARTDATGAFRMEQLPPGEWTLFAALCGEGTATAELTLDEGASHSWQATLEPGEVVRGRLLDAEGQPLAKRTIGWTARTGTSAYHLLATTDASGHFRIANAPATEGRLELYATSGSTVWSSGLSWPGEIGPQTVNAETGELSLQVDTEGEPTDFEQTELRLWSETLGRGQRLLADDAGRITARALAVGAYRAVLHLPDGARKDLGTLWIESGQATDLGQPTVPALAEVTLTQELLSALGSRSATTLPAEGKAALLLWTRGPHASHVLHARVPLTETPTDAGPFALPEGEVVLAFEDSPERAALVFPITGGQIVSIGKGTSDGAAFASAPGISLEPTDAPLPPQSRMHLLRTATTIDVVGLEIEERELREQKLSKPMFRVEGELDQR